MLSNPILHRVFTNPWFYPWVVAMVLPFLLWAVLVKLSHSRPDILPRIYPVLRVIAWGLWVSFVTWSLYGLFGRLERKTFYGMNGILWGLMGTNLMHSWVRRRVVPDSAKKYEGWWPAPKDLPEAKPGKNL